MKFSFSSILFTFWISMKHLHECLNRDSDFPRPRSPPGIVGSPRFFSMFSLTLTLFGFSNGAPLLENAVTDGFFLIPEFRF